MQSLPLKQRHEAVLTPSHCVYILRLDNIWYRYIVDECFGRGKQSKSLRQPRAPVQHDDFVRFSGDPGREDNPAPEHVDAQDDLLQRRQRLQTASTGSALQSKRYAASIIRQLDQVDYATEEEEDVDSLDEGAELRLEKRPRDDDAGADPATGSDDDYQASPSAGESTKQSSAAGNEILTEQQQPQLPNHPPEQMPHGNLLPNLQAFGKPVTLPDSFTKSDPVTFQLAHLMVEDGLSQNTMRRIVDIVRLATDNKKAYTFEDVLRTSELLNTVQSTSPLCQNC